VTKLHTRRGGFTLIELMIVVAIIGILAAIAIPNFLRFQLKAKSSEGKTNIAAIRTAEESYFAEYGSYVSALPSPAIILYNQKTQFVNAGNTSGVVGEAFDRIGWSPEGYVYFNYSVAVPLAGDEFTIGAVADIDNDGTAQSWGYRKGTEVSKAHADGQCAQAGLIPETVGPCDGQSGQSVF
jgi:type IV pilus assembly protein PilA